MAMRLYKKEEIIEAAAGYGLKLIETLEHHLVFQDKNGEPYSAPCPEEGCADYLFDIFIAKISKSDQKVIGIGISKKYDIEEN
jgi:hypothetical protein